VRSKLRQRVGLLATAAALGIGGTAALPAAEAHARYCSNTKICVSNDIPSFGGGFVDIHFDGWGNQNYFIEVFVSLRRYCTLNVNGNYPASIWRCNNLPAGQAWARSTTGANANHDITVWAP
jgi:hypothetical protein